MTDDTLDARLRAVERRCTDLEDGGEDADPGLLPTDRLTDLEDRLAEAERRLDALDAAVQSVRGYVGAVEHVNEEIERRADAALAVAERLEDDRPGRSSAGDDAGSTEFGGTPASVRWRHTSPPSGSRAESPSPADDSASDDASARRGILDRLLGR